MFGVPVGDAESISELVYNSKITECGSQGQNLDLIARGQNSMTELVRRLWVIRLARCVHLQWWTRERHLYVLVKMWVYWMQANMSLWMPMVKVGKVFSWVQFWGVKFFIWEVGMQIWMGLYLGGLHRC